MVKIESNRAAFATAMNACTRAVEKQTNIPVLGNVMIVGTANGLRITGTNLDLAISADIFAEGDSHFAATLPAHLLSDVVKKAKAAESIILSYDGSESVSILLGNRLLVDLLTLPVADFPVFQLGPVTHSAVIPTTDLVRAFQKVEFAISTEETRYYLNGVYVHHIPASGLAKYHGSHGKLAFAATDGRCMGIAELAAPADYIGMPGFIVPRETVRQFLALTKGKDAPDTVVFDVHGGTSDGLGPRLSFKIGAVTLAAKPIDGTFPDYDLLIPVRNESTMRVNVAEFDEAVQQVTCISSERGRAVRLAIGESRLCLSVKNPDAGKATYDLECESRSASADFVIGFNSRYVRDILAHIDGEAVTFMFADPSSPALIRGNGGADAGVTYILMPMRV